MTKKIILTFTVLLLLTTGAFAQEAEVEQQSNKPYGNLISVSLGIISAELSYERFLNDYFSILGSASVNWFLAYDFAFSAKGRLYPFGKAFFVELGLGYVYGVGYVEAGEVIGTAFGQIIIALHHRLCQKPLVTDTRIL